MNEKQLLEYLKRYHTGQLNVVSSMEIGNNFDVGQDIRRIVNYLRCEGHPICSDQNGYYYAASEKDLTITIRQLTS